MDILMLKANPIATAEAAPRKVPLGRPELKSDSPVQGNAPPGTGNAIDKPEKEAPRTGQKTPENLLDLFTGLTKPSGNAASTDPFAVALGKPDVKKALQDIKLPPSVDDLVKVMALLGVNVSSTQAAVSVESNQPSLFTAVADAGILPAAIKQAVKGLLTQAFSTPLPASELIDMTRPTAPAPMPAEIGPKPVPKPVQATPPVQDGQSGTILGRPDGGATSGTTETGTVSVTGAGQASGMKFDTEVVGNLNLTEVHLGRPDFESDSNADSTTGNVGKNGNSDIHGIPDAGNGSSTIGNGSSTVGNDNGNSESNVKGNGGPMPVEDRSGSGNGNSVPPPPAGPGGFRPTYKAWKEANGGKDSNLSGLGGNSTNATGVTDGIGLGLGVDPGNGNTDGSSSTTGNGNTDVEGTGNTDTNAKDHSDDSVMAHGPRGFQRTYKAWKEVNGGKGDINDIGGTDKIASGARGTTGSGSSGTVDGQLRLGIDPNGGAGDDASSGPSHPKGQLGAAGTALLKDAETIKAFGDDESGDDLKVRVRDEVTGPSSPPSAPVSEPTVKGVASKPPMKVETFNSVSKQIIDRMESMVLGKKSGTVTIKLDPIDMGSVTLTIKSFGSKIDTDIKASNDDVRAALNVHKNVLVSTIESRGLTMNSFTIGQEANAQAGNHQNGQANHSEAQRNAQLQTGLASAPAAVVSAPVAYSASSTAMDLMV